MKKALLYFALFIALQVGCILFVSVLAGLIVHVVGGDTSSVKIAANIYGMACSGLIISVLFVKFGYARLSRGGIPKSQTGVLILAAIGIMVGLLLPTTAVMENLPMPEELKELFNVMMNNSAGALAVSVIVPVAEELVFRGAILTALLRNGKKPWVAIVLSALFFGVAHFNPAQSANAFVLGLLLGWVYWRTGSLWPAIAIHITNNLLATVFTLWLGDMTTVASLFPDLSVRLTVLSVSLLVAVACFVVFYRQSSTCRSLSSELFDEKATEA